MAAYRQQIIAATGRGKMAKYKDADELLKRLNSCKYPAEKPTMRQATYNAAISDACRIVDAIPAVDIPRWIPVTERLPEEICDSYWVCTDSGYQCEPSHSHTHTQLLISKTHTHTHTMQSG